MTEPRRRKPTAPTCGCDPQLLGEIKGKLDMIHEGQQAHATQLNAMDGRLRSVETKGALAGAAAAMFMTLGLDLLKAKWFGK